MELRKGIRYALGLVAVVLLAGTATGPLTRDDRLALRTAQVAYLQSRLNLMQAQQEAIKAETDLSALIESLRQKYNCDKCLLTPDLEWANQPTPNQSPKPEATPGMEVPKAEGQKEKTQ